MLILFKKHLYLLFRNFLLLYFIALTACASVPRERVFDDFIIVRTEVGDSFSSLAATYMNDPEKDWKISELNNIANLSPGQELIIPLTAFEWGGLKANGYQVVPVLAYYGFSKNRAGELIVSEAAFKKQMKFLKENGYRVITLDQLLDFFELKDQIPEKSIAITFDGGRSSLYDIALPVLKDHGFPASVFVCPDAIGGKKALSWEQIEELVENGIDVQCKIKTRYDLTVLKDVESFKRNFRAVQNEIYRSKKTIKKKLNKECRYLAYPYEKTNNIIIALFKKEGFRAAFIAGRGDNPFFVNHYMINRSVIRGGFDMGKFKQNLSVFHSE